MLKILTGILSKGRRKTTLKILFAVVMALMPGEALQADVIYVSSNGDNTDGMSWGKAFNTLTAAIQFANAGDEIWIKEGLYAEQVTINEAISVYGGFNGSEANRQERDWDTNRVTLDAQGSGIAVQIESASPVIFDGIGVTGGIPLGIDNEGAGVQILDSSSCIRNCNIYDNGTQSFENRCVGGGIRIVGGWCEIENCRIEGNGRCQGGGGISASECVVNIRNTEILGNTGINSGGILLSRSTGLIEFSVINNNRVTNNGGGVRCGFSELTIKNCIIAGNIAGIQKRKIKKSVASEKQDDAIPKLPLPVQTEGSGVSSVNSRLLVANSLFFDNYSNLDTIGSVGGDTSSVFINCTCDLNGRTGIRWGTNSAAPTVISSILTGSTKAFPPNPSFYRHPVANVSHSLVEGGYPVLRILMETQNSWMLPTLIIICSEGLHALTPELTPA